MIGIIFFIFSITFYLRSGYSIICVFEWPLAMVVNGLCMVNINDAILLFPLPNVS